MQANWACATAKQSGPAHVHCHRPELRCAPASEEELPAEETAVHPRRPGDTCKLVQTARVRRRAVAAYGMAYVADKKASDML